MGRIDEQALVVNLAGKGLVVVVGCEADTGAVERIVFGSASASG